MATLYSKDLVFRLSGGDTNTDPDASLGGAISTVSDGSISSNVDNNVFDDVSGAEASAGDTEYRGIYIKNQGSVELANALIWINSETEGSDQIDIALAGEGKNGTMETIADESSAPSGESFSHPTTEGGALSLGSLASSDYYGIWLKRVVPADCGAKAANAATLRIKGEWTG